MTPEALAKFTPEEKRIAIAKAEGWIVTGTKFRDFGSNACHDYYGTLNGEEGWIPDYLHSLDAAIVLCDLLADQGWTCRIDNGLDKTWECTFDNGEDEHYAQADTLAQAICDAFLLSVPA